MIPIHDQDDRALLETFRASRSGAAFTELVRRHLPLVMQVARRRLPSRAVAEEAAQITFSLLANKIATVASHPERLMAWLCRTAYLTAKGLARKEARLTKIPLPPPERPAPMPPADLHDRLDAALNRLPELLESIQAQRLGPLIEFLPRATVADRRAIIAEDDIASHGEGSGRYRAAHTLAVQRWAEIDPAGAFAYGKARDIEGGFHGVGAVTRMVFQATLLSSRLQAPPPEEPRANFSPRERSSPRPDISSQQRISQLTRDFRAQPMSEWNRLWDSFAKDTDLATLKKLAGFPPTGRDACIVAERNLLQVLSREELAMRTGRVVVPAPEAFAALAEIDPAAAWRDLERHCRKPGGTAPFHHRKPRLQAIENRRFGRSRPRGAR